MNNFEINFDLKTQCKQTVIHICIKDGFIMSTPNTHLGAKKISELLEKCKSIYFIGIGGLNMSSLAHISHNRGFRVGGSDRAVSALTERLATRGIEIYHEHRAENIEGYDAVV